MHKHKNCLFRSPKVAEEADNDCDMPEIVRKGDDTDIESFERDEKQMEEEAARVSKQKINIFFK